jgi:SAM-dependent methyltransferase
MDHAIGDALGIMRDDWNRRAREDAYYYVAFVNPHQAECGFQRSAAEVVGDLEGELHRLVQLGAAGVPRRALEIGCGPGRLMLPLSRHFDEIYGVDISDEMIRLARERLEPVPNAHVLVNSGGDLASFEDNYFSFVYSYIVFQHIPSREIVLNYLREIQRVLVPGGITRFQVRGVPPSRANAQDPETWKGCVLSDSDIVDFARESRMELVALSGEQTQYMWVTLRKRPRPSLEAVTSVSSGSTRIPQRGPCAAISLWIRNAPMGSDLTTLSAHINGEQVRGTYLSPIADEGGCQMNVTLPRNLPVGEVEVALAHYGEVTGPARFITIEPALLVPRVAAVSDAKNIAMEMRSESGGVKVLIEDLEDPGAIEFQLAGTAVEDVDITSTNQVLNQYLFSFLLPRGTEEGPQTLSVYFAGRVLYQAELDIRLPAAPDKITLDAVTSASNGSSSVPQRGSGAMISLWIRNVPRYADLTTLSARINGEMACGAYLSPVTADGGCQMNVPLLAHLPAGAAEVALVHKGRVADPARMITVEPVVLTPRVVAIEPQCESGGVKVLMEDVEDPLAIGFQIAGEAVKDVDFSPTNQVPDQYWFSLLLPRRLEVGPRTLSVNAGGRVLYRDELKAT